MREHDRSIGRTGELVRPRYMVWENVCFSGDTLISCKDGYKRIDQIVVGDEVKTHTGQYRPVAKTMRTKKQTVMRLRVSGAEDILCTPNHPLYILEKTYKNGDRRLGREFTEPRWEAAENLNNRCMVAYKLDVPSLPENFITDDEAWALGLIQGVAFVQEAAIENVLLDALETIDAILDREVLTEDEK